MAKTQDLKRRIRSIGNTMQLTRAMKMVASAKLRRAQQRIFNARPYAHRMLSVLRSLAARVGEDLHPLLARRDGNRAHLVVITSDRGLCGAFNSHVIRAAEHYVREQLGGRGQITLSAIGKKGRDHFRRRQWDVQDDWTDVFRDIRIELAEEIADKLSERFLNGEVDQVYLAYNEFKSAIQARPVVQQLLPIEPLEVPEDEFAEDFLYEPSAARLLDALLPHYLRQQVFQALLESVAAEHAARMTAMDNATNNATDLIASLTLTMNRVRQASITTEIIEVVSGAEALG